MTWVTIDTARPLAELREAAGLTQDEAAAVLDAPKSTVTSPEGRGSGVRFAEVLRRAKAYGLVVEIRVRRKTT